MRSAGRQTMHTESQLPTSERRLGQKMVSVCPKAVLDSCYLGDGRVGITHRGPTQFIKCTLPIGPPRLARSLRARPASRDRGVMMRIMSSNLVRSPSVLINLDNRLCGDQAVWRYTCLLLSPLRRSPRVSPQRRGLQRRRPPDCERRERGPPFGLGQLANAACRSSDIGRQSEEDP